MCLTPEEEREDTTVHVRGEEKQEKEKWTNKRMCGKRKRERKQEEETERRK